MRSIIALICLSLAFSGDAFAQDIIKTHDGEEIAATILEVDSAEVVYEPFGPVSGSSKKWIALDRVSVLQYEDGRVVRFEVPDKPYTSEDLIAWGTEDAKEYYNKYKTASIGTYVTTVVAGPWMGLAPALATSLTHPKEHNLGYPDSKLMRDPVYRMAYEKQAGKMKRRKVWGGFGLGMATLTAVWVFLLVSTAR